MILATYLAVGAAAGLIAGMLGLGGGVVFVPALAATFATLDLSGPALMHFAVGTSLAAIVPTSVSSVIAHARRGAVDWGVASALIPGLMPGALLGSAIADQLPSDALARIFGTFVTVVAVQIFLDARAPGRRPLPGRAALGAWGGVIGTASTVLGIGGGSLTVPLLSYCRMPMARAVATSSACGLVLGVIGAAGFLYAGLDRPDPPPWSTGYVYWPAFAGVVFASVLTAPLGARAAHRLPTATLRRIFAVVLAGTGVRMLAG
jgi:uncharacterized protein